jgi:opacity protein-like surface antigen
MNRYIIAAVVAATVASATTAPCQSKATPSKAAASKPAASKPAGDKAAATKAAATKRAAPASTRSARVEEESSSGIGRGLMLGISAIAAPGITVKGEDIDGEISTKFGGGLGLQIGYGFAQGFMAFASLDLAKQQSGMDDVTGSFGLATFSVGGRYTIPLQSARVSPYVLAAVGARALGAEIEAEDGKSDVSLSGATFDVGGGLQLPLRPNLSLDTEVRVGLGKFGKFKQDDESTDIDVDNTMSPRVRLGLSWYPRAR